MKTIKKVVLEKINKGEIKMRPKWWFKALEITKKSGVLIFLMAGAVLVGMAIYIVSLINPTELLTYGRSGVEVLLQNISYSKLLTGILLSFIGGVIFSKIGANYKKSWLMIILMTVITLTLLVILITGVRIILEL